VFLKKAVGFEKIFALENPCESSMKNSIAKPYEGKLQVRFDEGGAGT